MHSPESLQPSFAINLILTLGKGTIKQEVVRRIGHKCVSYFLKNS